MEAFDCSSVFAFCACSFLHGRLRTCTLRSDYEGQSTLMNLLLRNYLTYNLYDQADKLVSKTTFPETASNNEWARYLFYLGKLHFSVVVVGWVQGDTSHASNALLLFKCDHHGIQTFWFNM